MFENWVGMFRDLNENLGRGEREGRKILGRKMGD
jgi:hypothetical protein